MCRSRSFFRATLAGFVGACIACSGDALSPSADVASVTISPSSPVLNVGTQVPLAVTLKDAHGNTVTGPDVFWSSSDTTIATVSDAGVVTAIAVGEAQIAASSQGQPGLATVTVTPVPVASIVIAPTSATATVGSTVDLQAVTYDAKGNKLTGRAIVWSSDHQSVATVDNSGHVKAVSQGQATISATSEGKSASATVTVTPMPVASVSVSPSTASVDVGKTVQLGATTRDQNGNSLTGRSVAWSSSNSTIASVDGSGKVTGVAAGTATITATSEGKNGSATITVNTPGPPPVSQASVASVDIDPSTATIRPGQALQLRVTLKDADGRTLTGRTVVWSSSNNAAAIVSETGLLIGITPGSATITATSEGKSGTSHIKVELKKAHDVTVGLGASALEVGQTTQATATVRADDGSVLTDRVVAWASSDGSVASITNDGLVTANAPGSATISGTSEGTSGSASLTVKQKSDDTGGTSSGDSGNGDHGKHKDHNHGHGGHG
ncbi:MAG TPA: Ig-like domain-containing protein [Gemmatimonadaceae bacterium]|nr:Ig-like domain-containing protein [Gemmatimonadaceae bacterium]